jgi:ubiquinone/menaquinone biosynthesis C-methylase UbiE
MRKESSEGSSRSSTRSPDRDTELTGTQVRSARHTVVDRLPGPWSAKSLATTTSRSMYPDAAAMSLSELGHRQASSVNTSPLWDRVAPIYDWQLPLEHRPIAAAVDLANPRPEDRVLDVATGTGAVLRALARRRSRPAVAIGLDRSQRMLARVPSLSPGWTLERGDATALPFPAGEFDLVIASYLLHLLDPSSLGSALSEIRRVLKPGGRLTTVTPIAPRSRLRRPYELTIAALVRLTGSSLGLQPMDPRQELARYGLAPLRARYVHRGYPSLCVLARATAV